MLRSMDDLTGYRLRATDGDIGRCADFLFDDKAWVVRYMVADTGRWIPKRQVLISPISLGRPDWEENRFHVHLTRGEIEEAPGIEKEEPVSRQHESELFRFWGYLPYWTPVLGEPGPWGTATHPADLRLAEAAAQKERTVATEEEGDPHLRSAEEVMGYTVEATDGEIGHVEDFIVDDESWLIRYVVIDTRNWLPGGKVAVARDWVRDFDWGKRKAVVDLTREEIKDAPGYDPAIPVNREYEERLYDFYGRRAYWR